MTAPTQDMRLVANAYREALRTGDQQLAGATIERKVLVAQVASSAQALRAFLQTRWPDGDRVGEPLDALIPELQKEDVVGNTLARLDEAARQGAVAVATSAVTGAAMPSWFLGVLGVIGGVFGFAYDAGQLTGTAIAALLATGASLAYGVFRVVAHAAPAAARAVEGGHESLMALVDGIGVRAERIFGSVVRPVLVAAFGPGEGVRQPPAGAALQARLKVVVFGTYAFLAVAAVIFVLGAVDAFSTATTTVAPTPSFPG